VSTTRNFVPVTLVDVRLEPGASFEEELPASYNGFLVPLGGAVRVTGSAAPLRTGEIGWLDLRDGDEPTRLRFTAEDGPARVLLYAGLRQREETVQRGPFVAGSLAGIAEMYRAYQRGRFIPVSRLRTR
jgi:redox-sensitive bicupin YhaK (pirin superfamily)